MNKIEFDTKIEGKPQAAFVILYALDGKPWLHHPGLSSYRRNLIIPTCLMINRADGGVGFVGGMVEKDETLAEAATRETDEEIGYNISTLLVPIVAHEMDKITSHAFASRLDYEELRKVQKEATNAIHFGSEVTGVFLPHLYDYRGRFGNGGGLVSLLRINMVRGAREQFAHFLINTDILTRSELDSICLSTNFTLDNLLQ